VPAGIGDFVVATRLSAFLEVKPTLLKKHGVFDALIGIDSRLFVDPILLKNLKIPELRDSRNRVDNYFRDVLFLLGKSEKENDAAWREAARRLVFKETHGVSLGYGVSSSDGSGIGRVLGQRILRTASEIVRMGITDPKIPRKIFISHLSGNLTRKTNATLVVNEYDVW
jgi:hypothetical protein